MANQQIKMAQGFASTFDVELGGPTNPVDVGMGNIDYLCFGCGGVVLACQDIGVLRAMVGVVATCAVCGSNNRVPLDAG